MIPTSRRRGIATALLIFILAIIVGGFFLIVMDQVVQLATSYGNQAYPVGVYDPGTLLFLQDGWVLFPVVTLIILSIWLYLRSQESGAGIE